MKRPKTLTFGPVTWRIKYQKDLAERRGQADTGMHVITLATGDVDKVGLRKAFCHELTHAALEDTPAAQVSGWSDEVEEAVCLAMEVRLLEFLTRPENRLALKWVTT